MLEEMWRTADRSFPCSLELPSDWVILAGGNMTNAGYF